MHSDVAPVLFQCGVDFCGVHNRCGHRIIKNRFHSIIRSVVCIKIRHISFLPGNPIRLINYTAQAIRSLQINYYQRKIVPSFINQRIAVNLSDSYCRCIIKALQHRTNHIVIQLFLCIIQQFIRRRRGNRDGAGRCFAALGYRKNVRIPRRNCRHDAVLIHRCNALVRGFPAVALRCVLRRDNGGKRYALPFLQLRRIF